MAKEYISRDEMIEQTKGRIVIGAPRYNDGLRTAIEVATSIPAADVVEVVRCGQCKHCVEHYDTDGNAPYWTCKEWDSGTDYDGYCHYGERKDGGQYTGPIDTILDSDGWEHILMKNRGQDDV